LFFKKNKILLGEIKNKKEIFMNISKKNKRSAMTLIEILIVITLLGILASVLVKSLGSSLSAGKIGAAKAFLNTTGPNAIRTYYLKTGKLPVATGGGAAAAAAPGGAPAPAAAGIWDSLIAANILTADDVKLPWSDAPFSSIAVGTDRIVISCIFPNAITATAFDPGTGGDLKATISTFNTRNDGNDGYAVLVEF
jgi:prepilin-type N-terminal cleavage/methylation domain-containing protein